MKRKTQNFALGLAALGFLALFLGTVLFLYPSWRQGGKLVRIQFRHDDGMAPIREGSQVLLSDAVEVGRVRRVNLVPVQIPPATQPQLVFLVETALREDLPIYGNAIVTTNQPAIGGAGYVSIMNIGTPDVPLDPTVPLRGLPPQSLSAAIGAIAKRVLSPGGLLDQISNVVDPEAEDSLLHKMLVSMDDVNAMTRELRLQMSPMEQITLMSKLHRVLDDFNATTGALREEMAVGNGASLLAKIHGALAHLEDSLDETTALIKSSRPLVNDTLVNVEHATRTIDQEMVAKLRSEFVRDDPDSLLAKVHAQMDRVDTSLKSLERITGESERLVVVNRPVIEQVLANFRQMSAHLDQASREILLNPSRLIWGPNREREDKLVVFRAATNFAEAASDLDTAIGRLQAILSTLPPEGRMSDEHAQELQSIYQNLRTTFQRFGRAEEVLWEDLK